MRITLVITCCFVILVCLGQLDAERCIRNTRRRPNRCTSSKVCCPLHFVHCVKKKQDIDGNVYYKICKRRRRGCSCMQGCTITQYGSNGGSQVEYFIPIGDEKKVGCKTYGCRAFYSADYSIINAKSEVKQTDYGCTNFQLTVG